MRLDDLEERWAATRHSGTTPPRVLGVPVEDGGMGQMEMPLNPPLCGPNNALRFSGAGINLAIAAPTLLRRPPASDC